MIYDRTCIMSFYNLTHEFIFHLNNLLWGNKTRDARVFAHRQIRLICWEQTVHGKDISQHRSPCIDLKVRLFSNNYQTKGSLKD